MEHKTNTKGKLKKALIAAFPHLCGLLVSGTDLRHLHERVGIQFPLSHDHEPDHLRGLRGVRGRQHAAGRLRAAAVAGDDADDQRETFILRDLHAG